MGWQEDLAALIADVQDGNAGDVAGAVGGGIVNALNLPGDVGKELYGQAANVLQREGVGEWGAGQEEWNRQIADLRSDDWGALGALKTPIELAANLAVDPTTYLGVGLAGKAGAAASRAGVPLLGKGLETAQAAYAVPGRVLMENVVQPGVRKIATGITRIPGASAAFEDAPETAVRKITDALTDADMERLQAAGNVPDDPMIRLAHKQRLAQGLDDPLISDEANRLFATPLKDGTTYGQALEAGEQLAKRDMEAIKATGVSWEAGTPLPDREKALEAFPELQTQIRKYGKLGIDPLNADDPRSVARLVLGKTVAEEAGVKHARSTVPSLLKAAWTEQVLFTPRYLMNNLFGNNLMMAIAGHNPIKGWGQYRATFQAARAGEDVVGTADIGQSLYATQKLAEYGQHLPEHLMRTFKPIELGGTRYSRSAFGEIAGRVTKSGKVARAVGAPFNLQNDIALTMDTVPRNTLYTNGFVDGIEARLPAWEQEVLDAGKNIPGFEGISKAQGLNVPAEGLFSLPVKNELMRQGMQAGQAEHLARRLSNIRKQASTEGHALANKVMFSWDRTNLDNWVGKVIPFHYWMSRSTRFWAEEAAQNPALAVNYMKYTQGMEEADDDPGLSARQKGFLHVLGTTMGFSLLTNPDALLGLSKFLDVDPLLSEPEMVTDEEGNQVPREVQPFKPEGETELGGALRWMKEKGIGLYPWVDGTLNLLGVYGNTFDPDLLGIRHKTLVGAAINAAAAHLGFDPIGAPYAGAMGNARTGISTGFSALAPDWLAQPVQARAGNSAQEATLDIFLENQIIANNPGLDNASLLEIMLEPDNPEYVKAYQQVSDAGVIEQLLNFTLPIKFKIKSDSKDVRTAQITEIREQAKAQGVAPFQFVPTPGDLAFAARYKRLTGSEWTPTDYTDAKTRHDLLRAPEAAKPFIEQSAAYYDLGSPQQQQAYDTYQSLINGEDPRTAGIADEGARREAARTWLSRTGKLDAYDELQQQRRAFEATHPEFGEYIGWRNQMYDLQTRLGGNLEEYRRQATAQNPNAAHYFATKWQWIMQTFPEDEWAEQFEQATVSAAAFNAITGKATNRNMAGPILGTPAADVTLPTMAPVGGDGYEGGGYNWAQELRNITSL